MDGQQPLRLPSTSEILKSKNSLNTNRMIAVSLSVLEEIIDEHDAALAKLKAALPNQYKEYVELANPVTDVRFESLRGRILKVANDGKRDLDDTIQNLRIE